MNACANSRRSRQSEIVACLETGRPSRCYIPTSCTERARGRNGNAREILGLCARASGGTISHCLSRGRRLRRWGIARRSPGELMDSPSAAPNDTSEGNHRHAAQQIKLACCSVPRLCPLRRSEVDTGRRQLLLTNFHIDAVHPGRCVKTLGSRPTQPYECSELRPVLS